MAKVTGLGGIFYKVADPDRTRAWYQETLGIGGEWGAMFPWSIEAGNDAYSLFSPFKASTDYFDPSSAAFLVNLRVDDLAAFLAELKSKGGEVRSEERRVGKECVQTGSLWVGVVTLKKIKKRKNH